MSLGMKLWSKTGFIEDQYKLIGSEDELPQDYAIVPIQRLDETIGHSHRAVLIEPQTSLETLKEALRGDFNQLSLIALNFPAFSDGRSYSKAQLLKTQFGFNGIIRGVGDILPDQLGLMLRVGFEELSVSHKISIQRLEAGQIDFHQHYMQALSGDELPDASQRRFSWRRV